MGNITIEQLREILEAQALSCPHAYRDNRQDAPYLAGHMLAIDQVIEIIDGGWHGGDTPRLRQEIDKIHRGTMPRQGAA